MKYTLLKSYNEYTLREAVEGDSISDGEAILIFEADTWEQAMVTRNQFLHFEPYQPFDKFWYVKVLHQIVINGKLKSKANHEIRVLLVMAADEAEARTRVSDEVKRYGLIYQNMYNQPVSRKFIEVLELKEADFLKFYDLYSGVPIEIYSKRITKKTK
jgi:hypothetical protein